MLSQLFIDILPGLIAVFCGILARTLFRLLSKYSPFWEGLTEQQARGVILISVRNICVILTIVCTILVFTKYAFSYGAVITTAYLAFLVSTILWGILMGIVKRFIPLSYSIKILQKL
jgi:hypothetical protein